MPAQLFIRHLSRCAGEPLAFDAYLYGRIFEHILAPVLPVNFTRRRVKTSLIINEAEFYCPSRAGLAANGG